MTIRGWAGVVGAVVVAASEVAADPSFLGGLRPVAAEESARSLWVNPAAIGAQGLPRAFADVVWFEQDDLRPADARRLSMAVSMLDAAYGIQVDLADEAGVPDWVLAWGKRMPLAGRLSLGLGLEWRGGKDSGLDAALGAVIPHREWRLAAAVTNLLEPTTEEVQAVRTWQLGVAWRPRSMPGRITYDAVLPSGSDSRHWFIASPTRIMLGPTVDIVLGSHLAGVGVHDPDGGTRREFASWEWTGREDRFDRGPRTGNRR